MKIALLQFAPVWHNSQENLNVLTNKIQSIDANVDLIVLPEMFTTGFTMQPKLVWDAPMGKTLQWMQKMAQIKDCAITGSVVIKDEAHFYNRLYFVFPDGDYQTYDKHHLFTLAGEQHVFQAGKEKIIIDYKGWKIAPLICYDLRFPVYARIVDEAYDVLLYVASWPDQRIYAWDSLLKARAIENMSYVIGVNRCGTDADGNLYEGHSQALDYLGAYLQTPMIGDDIKVVTLSQESIKKARTKLAFLKDADRFNLEE